MAYTECQKNLAPGDVLCSEQHCSKYRESSTMTRYCKCLNPDGSTIPDCKPQGGGFPVETGQCVNSSTGEKRNISLNACLALREEDKNWNWQVCFCCCSCFAYDTLIAIAPEVFREVQTIEIGDEVRSATLKSGGSGGAPVVLDWEQRRVTYSDGMTPHDGQTAVVLQYGDGSEMSVTPDQPMMLSSGKLKRADTLSTDDKLVDRNGNPVDIHAVVLGKRFIGFHSLTTNDFEHSDATARFLEANGVIAGDHMVLAMQSADELAALFVEGHDDEPTIGTPEYAERHGCEYSSVGDGAYEIASSNFLSIAELRSLSASVPYGASSYLTAPQARDILKDATFRPLGHTFLVNEFNYYKRLFGAFFPDVHFHLDWEDYLPNMYAFRQYGLNVVYVSGQLLRFEEMRKEGLAMIMAQGLARFEGAKTTTGDNGLACTGVADYMGANEILQTVFYGEYNAFAVPGYMQINKLFSYISDAHMKGTSKCDTPSIPCRLEAMDAAISGFALPPCAGGPEPETLKLETAVWSTYQSAAAVLAHFSLRLDPTTASKPDNYLLSYEKDGQTEVLPITAAELDESDPSAVSLVYTGEVTSAPVTLSVRNVLADNGSTLDPDATSVTVTQ